MACPGNKCGSKSTTSPSTESPAEDFVDFTLRSTDAVRIRSGNGQFYSLMIPMIKISPPIGWRLGIKVNGHNHMIEGSSAKEVVSKIRSLYSVNEIELSELNAWYNANMIWVRTVSVKHSYTTIADLRAIQSGETEKVTFEKSDPSPLNWGGAAWTTMGAYLARTTFDLSDFLDLCNILYVMVDDDFIGCEECEDHFAKALVQLDEAVVPENGIRFTQYDAARWMWSTMNDIRNRQGRPELSWDQAVSVHRWENLTESPNEKETPVPKSSVEG